MIRQGLPTGVRVVQVSASTVFSTTLDEEINIKIEELERDHHIVDIHTHVNFPTDPVSHGYRTYETAFIFYVKQ